MLAYAGAKSPTKVTERAVLYESLGLTPKTNASSKKRAGSREDALDASTRTEKAPPTTIYDVELGGTIEVAIRKAPPVKLVHVRAFTTQAAPKTLHVYRQLQHRNIVTAFEAFTTDNGLYIVLEHMPLSLERIVRSPAYPNERQLATILGQVVTGMAYLAAERFEHGSLTCSNILLNTDGDVKISE
ncbi:kinase-like domain-containing protein [Leptodontidium sp. MPI-SDFR-AT-0119]|nr:kinase-like domain-containing protein [Leptodontidium sp. MPI-SDFR-AT-0119]